MTGRQHVDLLRATGGSTAGIDVLAIIGLKNGAAGQSELLARDDVDGDEM